MKALVLTAGLGTRLKPLTDVRAKPAIPVAGEPMIRRIIRWLASHSVTDLVLNLHHRPETITAVLGDGSDLGVQVRYSWEQPMLLGTAGGPRLAAPLLGTPRFLIVNGDTLTNVDLAALVSAHEQARALVTLALVPNREFRRYGGVTLDADGRVLGFVRRGPQAEGSFHYVGVQVAEAAAFAPVDAGAAASSIGGVYDDWIASRPGSVRGVVSNAEFWDVGTASDYWQTSFASAGDPAGGSQIGERARIDRSALVSRSILWDDVDVAAGATLEDCIVTDGVRVPEGARHRRAILVQRDENLAVIPLDIREP